MKILPYMDTIPLKPEAKRELGVCYWSGCHKHTKTNAGKWCVVHTDEARRARNKYYMAVRRKAEK